MKSKINIIYKQSKIINVGNTCAFDTLTFWINLIPTNHGVEILNLLEPNLKNAIIELTKQLYIDSSDNFYLQTRLENINKYIKNYYNVNSYELLSIDDMLYDNETLLESGYLTETFDDFKDISIQIINLGNIHYAIKILINDDDNDITNIIYIDDLNYCGKTKHAENNMSNEKIVLICNVGMNELPNICDKIENMCI